MSEAQVVPLACPSGALSAGQSMGCAGDVPGDTAAWVGDAWNALWFCSTMGRGMAWPRLGKDTAGLLSGNCRS